MNVIPRLDVHAADRVMPAPFTAPVVTVRGLTKQFTRGQVITAGLDLDIAHGSKVAIIGANGTGKSTLIRMLVRLVEPSGGRDQCAG